MGMGKLIEEGPDAFGVPFGAAPTTPWSNAWAREFWAGAITPLHFSIRAAEFEANHREWRRLQGAYRLAEQPFCRYRQATAYVNSEVEARHAELFMPPPDRLRFARAIAGQQLLRRGCGVLSWMPEVARLLYRDPAELDGPSEESLRALDDRALERHMRALMGRCEEANLILWVGFFVYAPWAIGTLGWMLEHWYEGEGEPAALLADLARGSETASKLALEQRALWDLGRAIGASPRLREQLERRCGAAFFAALEADPEGREIGEAYSRFLVEFGHLGAADRDLFHPRRSEDPRLDVTALRLVCAADPVHSPARVAAAQKRVREAAGREVVENLGAWPLGRGRAAAFTAVLGYVQRFWTLRDDQRYAFERLVMAKKRAVREIGRRAFERDLLDRGDDFWFLSLDELTALLRDRDAAPELPATIDSRRQAFERMLSGQARQPLHLRGSTPLAEEPPRPPAPGAVLAATPMSAGEATGTARVVRHLDQIERLGRGDVLVCAATDPGWSSAFLVANAVIVEHGGGLSFAGRMSREHSLPAVALPHATELIADGATVSVDGGRGSVALGTAPPERSTSREGSRLHS